jgi:hypothetical protein
MEGPYRAINLNLNYKTQKMDLEANYINVFIMNLYFLWTKEILIHFRRLSTTFSLNWFN